MLTNRLEPLNTRKWPKKCAVVKRPQHLRATFSFLILILFLIIFTNPPSNCEENRATTLVSTSLSPHHFLQITSYSSLHPCVENILKSYATQPKPTTALHSSKRHNDKTNTTKTDTNALHILETLSRRTNRKTSPFYCRTKQSKPPLPSKIKSNKHYHKNSSKHNNAQRKNTAGQQTHPNHQQQRFLSSSSPYQKQEEAFRRTPTHSRTNLPIQIGH